MYTKYNRNLVSTIIKFFILSHLLIVAHLINFLLILEQNKVPYCVLALDYHYLLFINCNKIKWNYPALY